MSELSPGQIIGKCRIITELGRGGMGAVYLAEHINLNIQVAVKILLSHMAAMDPDFSKRFLREAQLAARIRHNNVIAVMDADRDEAAGLNYIVLEYVDGTTLKHMLNQHRFDEHRALEIIRDTAKALAAASEMGVVHRDIKPENIMITKHGVVKLADLGLARQVGTGREDVNLTMEGASMGTPLYMSPEQIEDARSVDIRTDIYSLGATLYYMLVGSPPFEGNTSYGIISQILTKPNPHPWQKRPELSNEICALCLKMMAKDKKDRPASPQVLIDEIEVMLSKNPAPTTPAAPLEYDWDAAYVQWLEAAITAYVPDFNPGTVRQISKACASLDELLKKTSVFIADDSKRAHFLAQCTPAAPADAISSDSDASKSLASANPSWDPAVLKKIETALAVHIGPLAKVLIKKAAKKFGSKPELVKALAENISNEKDRKAFLGSVQ